MGIDDLVNKAKDFVEEHKDDLHLKERAEGLKEDLGELKDIATGEGSLMDKAKAAVEAIKDPGAPGEEAAPQAPADAPPAP
jgi:hypothetical protein